MLDGQQNEIYPPLKETHHSIEKDKANFRTSYKKKIEKLSSFQRTQRQNQILKQLNKLPFWKEADFIAGYKALKSEPSLEAFYKLWKDKICYPVVEKEKLEFYKSSGSWKKSSLSVLEPAVKKQNKIPLDRISIFLIPGLAFDRKGSRLGRGGGYYDRTLASLPKEGPFYEKRGFVKGSSKGSQGRKALFIGLAFIEQVSNENLPLREHDIFVDILVTDRFVLIPLNRDCKTLDKTEVFNSKDNLSICGKGKKL